MIEFKFFRVKTANFPRVKFFNGKVDHLSLQIFHEENWRIFMGRIANFSRLKSFEIYLQGLCRAIMTVFNLHSSELLRWNGLGWKPLNDFSEPNFKCQWFWLLSILYWLAKKSYLIDYLSMLYIIIWIYSNDFPCVEDRCYFLTL